MDLVQGISGLGRKTEAGPGPTSVVLSALEGICAGPGPGGGDQGRDVE